MGFALPYWKLFLTRFVLVLCAAGLGLVQPLVTEWIVDGILETRRFDLLIYGALAIVGTALLSSFLRYLQRYGMSYAGQSIIYDIRNRIYQHLQQLSYSFYDETQTGQLMSRVTSDVETAQRFITGGMIDIISSLVTLVATFALMASKNLKLTLLAMIPVPFLAWRVQVYSQKIRPLFRENQEQLAILTVTLQENITGQRVVKAFSRKAHEMQKFETDNMNLLERRVRTSRLSALNESFMSLLTESSLAIILLWGGHDVMAGAMTVGALFAFNQLLLQLIRPIRMMGWWVSSAQQAIASGDRIFEILDTQAEVTDAPDAKLMPKIEGGVVFEDVSFSYDGSHMVLEDINLSAKPGETIAVLGGTGSGKSTLINLIPRFYDVNKGRILIDGLDIRDVTVESLRRQIGIVTQETFLFSSSLRDNIAYGKPHATDEEVRAAAKAAHIDDFIGSLPKGYDTVIGERGVGLSGGQKQRVAIARALLMDARILLLDESTSSVDVDTEMKIQEAFGKLLQNRTSFIIAQRLSTIRNADRIIVLDKGRIAEVGTHETLLARDGIYTAIYNLQFRSQEAEEFNQQVALAEGGDI